MWLSAACCPAPNVTLQGHADVIWASDQGRAGLFFSKLLRPPASISSSWLAQAQRSQQGQRQARRPRPDAARRRPRRIRRLRVSAARQPSNHEGRDGSRRFILGASLREPVASLAVKPRRRVENQLRAALECCHHRRHELSTLTSNRPRFQRPLHGRTAPARAGVLASHRRMEPAGTRRPLARPRLSSCPRLRHGAVAARDTLPRTGSGRRGDR